MTKIGRLNGLIAARQAGRQPTMAFVRAEREEAIQHGVSPPEGGLCDTVRIPLLHPTRATRCSVF